MKILNLYLFRTHLKEKYTIGNLYHTLSDCKNKNMNILSKGYICDTLENKFRGNDLTYTKVAGETCIPEGTYKIVMTWSNHFKKMLPKLMEVPFFTDIFIHSGNTPKDTKGCVITGENKIVGAVINSILKLNEVITLIQKADLCDITVRNV